MPDDVPGIRILTGTDVMCHLHGKTGRNCGQDSIIQPGHGNDQTDGGRGSSTQSTDHGRINVLHGDGGDLRQNGGQTQLPDLFYFRF